MPEDITADILTPRMSRYSRIIFDFDGTLSDSMPGIVKTLNTVMEEFSLPALTKEQVRLFVGNGIPSLIERSCAFVLDEPAPNPDLVENIRARYMLLYRTLCMDDTSLYDGVRSLLQNLNHCSLYVISNKTEEMTRFMLDRYGILNYFLNVLGGDSAAQRKPHPAPFRLLGPETENRSEWLMVGDSLFDLDFAANCGIDSAACAWGYGEKEELRRANPTYLLESAAELSKILIQVT